MRNNARSLTYTSKHTQAAPIGYKPRAISALTMNASVNSFTTGEGKRKRDPEENLKLRSARQKLRRTQSVMANTAEAMHAEFA